MSSDRNLLFGILAVQMNFILPGQLIDALNRWLLDKQLSLSTILVDSESLTRQRAQLLEAVVEEHLKSHGQDAQECLATLPYVESLKTSLQHIADPDVQHSIQVLNPASNKRLPSVEETTGLLESNYVRDDVTPKVASQRYRILRPFAKGGLGEIFVAEDMELHREVALKEIQAQHAHNDNSKGRFILEAEVTGKLEHPNIVPVYGMGTYADGRPFYAMRFIRGNTLQNAIDEYHKLPVDNSPERNLLFRNLLKRFIDVCHAVAYAHSRRILHRDLKPTNIMLGKFGETFVVDWGLAKPTESSTPIEEGDSSSHERTMNPVTGTYAETQDGSAIGTPAFMSPEQAAGRIDEINEPSDIYSLGATLYVVATGQAPFLSSESILKRVEEGDFKTPASLKPDLAPALNAIILKAMANAPRDRYSSALLLASDVEHFLADEVVTAYRDPIKVRIKRWVRKNPGVSGALVSTFLFLLFGTGYGLAILSTAYSWNLTQYLKGSPKSGSYTSPKQNPPPGRNPAAPKVVNKDPASTIQPNVKK